MPPEIEETGAIDVDQLLADVEAGNEINPTEPAVEAAPAAAIEQATQEIEFTWNGKPIKAPVDKIKTYASQGYDYAQRMQEFKAKQAEFEKSQQDFEPLRSRYSELDEYAKANPAWLEQVNASYLAAIGKAESQGQGQAPEIQQLKQELQELKTFKNEITTEREAAKAEKEDQQLDQTIQSIQEKYKDLDWKSADSEGKTLETQVLEFGIQNGIKSFEHAFKLFNHDSLITIHSAKAKEDQVKAKQAQTRAGLLGETPAPTKQLTRATSLKSKSYNDLTREALEEYGLEA